MIASDNRRIRLHTNRQLAQALAVAAFALLFALLVALRGGYGV